MTIIERIADELARISPETTIYTENQPNGFDEPCFFISSRADTPLIAFIMSGMKCCGEQSMRICTWSLSVLSSKISKSLSLAIFSSI